MGGCVGVCWVVVCDPSHNHLGVHELLDPLSRIGAQNAMTSMTSALLH